MTRLIAEIKDFRLKADAAGAEVAYQFRIANSEDFMALMNDFKRSIPASERAPDTGKNWLWTVKATPANYAALSRLFDNFAACYEADKAQLRLFP